MDQLVEGERAGLGSGRGLCLGRGVALFIWHLLWCAVPCVLLQRAIFVRMHFFSFDAHGASGLPCISSFFRLVSMRVYEMELETSAPPTAGPRLPFGRWPSGLCFRGMTYSLCTIVGAMCTRGREKHMSERRASG